MKTIILIRHGESETNLKKVFTGQLDAPLTPNGERQAALMAQYVNRYSIDKIYVSPLQRAVDTAQKIVEQQHCTMERLSAFKELYAGQWQGKTFEEIAREYPESYEIWRKNIGMAAPEGGETCEEMYRRVTNAFVEILQRTSEKVICIVCHAIPIRMIESYIRQQSPQNISWVPNASVTVYEYDGNFCEIERGACAYLGESQTNLPKNI